MQSFRQRLSDGAFLLGTHINGADSSMTELLGGCGFDYLWLDTEHTALDYQTLQHHLIAARAAGCPALVRVPWNEAYLAKRVLELGPDGVVFPMIRSAAEAREAVAACLYPPAGRRNFGPIRAMGYGLLSPADYLASAQALPCLFLQIEHVDAVRELDAILQVPGVDGLILGPCDLSGSVGLLGQTEHPQVAALIDETIARCRAAGMPVGVSLGGVSPEALERWRRRGVQLLSAGSEYSFLLQAARRLTAARQAP